MVFLSSDAYPSSLCLCVFVPLSLYLVVRAFFPERSDKITTTAQTLKERAPVPDDPLKQWLSGPADQPYNFLLSIAPS